VNDPRQQRANKRRFAVTDSQVRGIPAESSGPGVPDWFGRLSHWLEAAAAALRLSHWLRSFVE